MTSSAAVERTAAAVAIAIARRICGRTGSMMRQGEGALAWDMGSPDGFTVWEMIAGFVWKVMAAGGAFEDIFGYIVKQQGAATP